MIDGDEGRGMTKETTMDPPKYHSSSYGGEEGDVT